MDGRAVLRRRPVTIVFSMSGQVLIVEDEPSISGFISAYLEREGYGTLQVRSGEQALTEISRSPFQMVVLDINLPGIDGFEVCRQLRTRTSVPILILSAREDEVDRVAGLEAGADDYVTKPFSPRELVARIKAILRRGGSQAILGNDLLSAGDVTLRRDSHEVAVAGQRVELTSREFELLAALLSHVNVALSRERLLQLVWGQDFPGGTRTVDVHIAQLRRKLGRAEMIKTVPRIGYKVVA